MWKLAAASLCFCALGLAAVPVATAIAAEPFRINGASIAAPGVTSWPLVSGDEVGSPAGGPLVVDFHDGSSVKVGPGSRGRIENTSLGPKFILLAGTLDFKLVAGSSLAVTSLDLERKRNAGARSEAHSSEPAVPKRGPQIPSEPKLLVPWSSNGGLQRMPPVSRRY